MNSQRKLSPGFGRVAAALVLAAMACGPAAAGEVLLDDPFDGNGLGVGDPGAVDGGVHVVHNGNGGATGSLEEESQARLSNPVHNHNGGIVSNVAVGSAEGLRLRVVVSETGQPQYNGMFLGFQDDSTTFYRNEATRNLGLIFFGETSTGSAEGFSLVVDDVGNGSRTVVVASRGGVDPASFRDGFVAAFEARPDGWSVAVDGLVCDGAPGRCSMQGTWAGAGLAESFYADFFDGQDHPAAYAQGTIDHAYDRLTVTSVPEPASSLLLGIAAVPALRRRRRRREQIRLQPDGMSRE